MTDEAQRRTGMKLSLGVFHRWVSRRLLRFLLRTYLKFKPLSYNPSVHVAVHYPQFLLILLLFKLRYQNH